MAKRNAETIRAATSLVSPVRTIQRFNDSTELFSPTNCSTRFPFTVSAGTRKIKNGSSGASPSKAKNLSGSKLIRQAQTIQPSIFNLALLDVLPDSYTIETSPAAENWWREAAEILQHGKLLTIDYGLTEDEIYSPARTNGTLRGYFRHRVADDILANIGEQDLTAHINFSAIQKAGEEAGLKTESFSTQPKFLTQILAKTQKDKKFGEWNSNARAPVSNPHTSRTSWPRLPCFGSIALKFVIQNRKAINRRRFDAQN